MIIPVTYTPKITDYTTIIQEAVNEAIRVNGDVVLSAGRFTISKPIMLMREGYKNFTVKITGQDTMWSVGRTIIKATFKEGALLNFQNTKGSQVSNLWLEGTFKMPTDFHDADVRDLKDYSHAAICIDPINTGSTSGSTGVIIDNCTFRNVACGLNISPNGKTLNAELITAQNIRTNDCWMGAAGHQAQEKLNRFINWGMWGNIHTCFAWLGQPGNYVIDGVNIAGNAYQIVHRYSGKFFPLHIHNVFSEGLGRIGYWNTSMSDSLNYSSINFQLRKAFPTAHVEGTGLTINNSDIRYYGATDIPILFAGDVKLNNCKSYTNPILGTRYWPTDINYQNGFTIEEIGITTADKVTAKKGDIIIFYEVRNLNYVGMCKMIDDNKPGFISKKVMNGEKYRIGKYKSK